MATCKNRAWQAAQSLLICKQGVVGSSPIISTAPLRQGDQGGDDLGEVARDGGADLGSEAVGLFAGDLHLVGDARARWEAVQSVVDGHPVSGVALVSTLYSSLYMLIFCSRAGYDPASDGNSGRGSKTARIRLISPFST
jgi:hypothetical protein